MNYDLNKFTNHTYGHNVSEILHTITTAKTFPEIIDTYLSTDLGGWIEWGNKAWVVRLENGDMKTITTKRHKHGLALDEVHQFCEWTMPDIVTEIDRATKNLELLKKALECHE